MSKKRLYDRIPLIMQNKLFVRTFSFDNLIEKTFRSRRPNNLE